MLVERVRNRGLAERVAAFQPGPRRGGRRALSQQPFVHDAFQAVGEEPSKWQTNI